MKDLERKFLNKVYYLMKNTESGFGSESVYLALKKIFNVEQQNNNKLDALKIVISKLSYVHSEKDEFKNLQKTFNQLLTEYAIEEDRKIGPDHQGIFKMEI